MPLPRIQRGELWVVDLGYLGGSACRCGADFSSSIISAPCLRCSPYHLVLGTRFEVAVNYAMSEGIRCPTNSGSASDQICAALVVDPAEMRKVENALAQVLGLKLAASGAQREVLRAD